MTLKTGDRVGAYDILALLGQGGMGEVYRARDPKLDRDVALKVLPAFCTDDPDRLARLEREAKALAALNHPHMAQIYGFEHRDLKPANIKVTPDGVVKVLDPGSRLGPDDILAKLGAGGMEEVGSTAGPQAPNGHHG